MIAADEKVQKRSATHCGSLVILSTGSLTPSHAEPIMDRGKIRIGPGPFTASAEPILGLRTPVPESRIPVRGV